MATITAPPPSPTLASPRPRTARLVRAGLWTAAADALFGLVQYVAAGVPSPVARFFQGIASVVLGPQPDHGGAPAVALGLALHLAVAFFWAGVFAALLARSRRLGAVLDGRHGAPKVALVYGPTIWTVMSFAVIAPLLRRPPAVDAQWWVQFFGHVLSAGLPIALAFRTRAR